MTQHIGKIGGASGVLVGHFLGFVNFTMDWNMLLNTCICAVTGAIIGHYTITFGKWIRNKIKNLKINRKNQLSVKKN